MAQEDRPADKGARPGAPEEIGSDSWSETVVDGAAAAEGIGPVSVPGYRILDKIHQGGQGVVFRAHQFSTKRTVAIKVLREGALASDTARKRFQREVEIAARLEHSNIVAVFDSGRTREGHPYYVMEYVRGQDLEAYVRSRRPTVDRLLRLFLGVLAGVHHAHQHGVVHRDLKTANILVDGEDRPKVLDFGLARREVGTMESVLSTDGQFVGTVATMSPEQVRGDIAAIDARTDVYALGIILYQLLTGGFPYPVKGQLVDVLRHITDTPPVPPSRAWTHRLGVAARSDRAAAPSRRSPIDGDLETVVLKAIAKEKERRYADARAFAEDIRRYLEGRPIEAKRDSGLYVLRKRLARNRTVLPALAGAAVMTIVAALWITLQEPARPPIDPALLAQLRSSEADYVLLRDDLYRELGGIEAAAGEPVNAAARRSLAILENAVRDLEAAVAADPGNVELHQLLLGTYEKEVGLLRRMVSLPTASR